MNLETENATEAFDGLSCQTGMESAHASAIRRLIKESPPFRPEASAGYPVAEFANGKNRLAAFLALYSRGLGVTKGAVSQWMTAVAGVGVERLYARPHTGGPVKLPFTQRLLIPELPSHGAEAYGFRGEVWTCARVAKVIKWEFGVAYHPAHVSRILKDLRWTPQKPIARASQRNEALIEHWRTEVWPELKKRPAWSGVRRFVSMNLASFCWPAWVRTYAPSGKTPILKVRQTYDDLGDERHHFDRPIGDPCSRQGTDRGGECAFSQADATLSGT